MTTLRAEVWGSPIAHSRSPDLHLACYSHLGIHGTYTKREVTEANLPEQFNAAAATLTGISLTMPLKTGILDRVSDHRGDVDTLGAANTAINTDGHWWLANTDPLGAAAMLRHLLPHPTADVVLLGAGATAKSIVLGLHHVAFSGRLTVVVRSASRAAEIVHLGEAVGIPTNVLEFDALNALSSASLVISTLPSGTLLPDATLDTLCSLGAPLMDVGYHPWPTPLAGAFMAHGLDIHSGLPMLMFQALGQIRAFVNGDTLSPLPDEAGALRAMARAIDLDEVWATPSLMGE